MKNGKLFPVLIFLITLIIYVLFAGRFNLDFKTSQFNYFSHQAHSFLNLKLSLFTTEQAADLSVFNGKKYLYWGPTPTFLIIPFIILFGINFSDSLYTAILGALSPLLIYLILLQLRKINFIKIDNFKIFLIGIFFAFGTTHFYQSVIGGVWQTSQVISNLYILFAIFLFYSFFLKKNLAYLVLSSVFFGLAVWARQTYVFYLPFFLILLYLFTKKDLGVFKKNVIYFIIPLIFLVLTTFVYNYLRFDSFFENGYSYHNFNPHFLEDFKKYGSLNLAYVPKNFSYMFLHLPEALEKFPYFNFDKEGNSIVFVSPFILLSLFIIKKEYRKSLKDKHFNTSILISTGLIISILLMFWGTGFAQFSYRYFLDALPLVILLIAKIINRISLWIVLPLLIISILMNTLGTLWMMYS